MKQRARIYYTEEQKALMWDRWQKGESLNAGICTAIIFSHRFCSNVRSAEHQHPDRQQ